METKNRFQSAGRLTAAFLLYGLTACNTNELRINDSTTQGDPDHYHEKSFSWDAKSGTLSKGNTVAAISAKETRFNSELELMAAIHALDDSLKDKAFTDSLWKPVDYACHELDLALWNHYGTILLGDSVVFDENMLKQRCLLTERAREASDTTLRKGAGWTWWSQSETSDRQYPYKMIGRSWDNYNLVIYKSTGGETQFEKHRSRFGITAWYDTDATHIAVRAYLMNCGINKATGVRTCYVSTTKTSSGHDRDNVDAKDAGFSLAVTLTEALKPGLEIKNVRVNDAVMSMHSVEHAGLNFYAQSSSGISASTPIEAGNVIPSALTW